MTEAIETHVQTYYTRSGISVKSRGERSVVLSLPADCPDASDLVVDLVSEFSCTIDFALDGTEPFLTVWLIETGVKKTTTSNFLVNLGSLLCVALLALTALFLLR